MKILFVSCHSVLEQEELTLFTELGHDVFSLGGAYSDPKGNNMLPRPGIPGMIYHEDLDRRSREFPRTEIPEDFIDNFDVIIVMHMPEIIDTNWKRFKKKKVIYRSIGQSRRDVERILSPLRAEGLKIVRYSPKELLLSNYVGSDALIRFYKDSEEFKGWNGNTNRVINITQSIKGRENMCHYNEITKLMNGFPSKIFGNGNEELGTLNGGAPDYQHLKEVLRDNKVYVYGGTWPAPYTLSFIEAWMTGIPVVAIGKETAENVSGIAKSDQFEFYEIQDFIQNNVNGFISNDLNLLRDFIGQLLMDHSMAKRIGEAGRQSAVNIFSKDKIRGEWKNFLEAL